MYWQENYLNKYLATVIALSIAFTTPLVAINEPAASVSNQQDQTSTPHINRSAVKRPTSLLQNIKTRLNALREYIHTKKELCKEKFKTFTDKHPRLVHSYPCLLVALVMLQLYILIRIESLPHRRPTGHYAALGIDESASPEEIEAAFERCSRLPWFLRGPLIFGNKERYCERITQAHAVLTDPNKRRLYDTARIKFNFSAYNLERFINEELTNYEYREEVGNTIYTYRKYLTFTDERGEVQNISYRDLANRILHVPDHRTLHDVLNLERNATERDIKSAYRTKALECHPDKNLANREAATERFKQIKNAYEVLSDPENRSSYEKNLPLQLCEQWHLPQGFFSVHFRKETNDRHPWFTPSSSQPFVVHFTPDGRSTV